MTTEPMSGVENSDAELVARSLAGQHDAFRQIIQMLGAVENWRERPDWSGLVEQQAICQKGR